MGASRGYDWQFKINSTLPYQLAIQADRVFNIMQKPLSFRIVPIYFLLLLAIASCKLNPNLQTQGVSFIQGEWQQDSIPAQNRLLTYSLYHLKFTCDSFYFDIHTNSKVNIGPDTCMQAGKWTEYIKGTYVQQNDTLHLKGLFCNKNWTIKSNKGCLRYGDYEEFIKLKKQDSTHISFAITTIVIPVNARLIKKNTCHPKPI